MSERPVPSFEELVMAAGGKGLYLEVHVWNDDYLEARVGFPDVSTAAIAARTVLEVIEEVHG